MLLLYVAVAPAVAVPHVEVLLQAVAFLRHLVVQGAVCSALHAVKLVALLLPAKKFVVLLTELVVWEIVIFPYAGLVFLVVAHSVDIPVFVGMLGCVCCVGGVHV